MKKQFYILALCFTGTLGAFSANAQYINRYAGNGSYGYSGDGGQATAASMAYPVDFAVSSTGNVFVTEAGNHIIRKISTTGVITTFGGNGSIGYSGDGGVATAATMDAPFGIAINGSTIYFTDYSQHAIRKITSSGVISKVAGTPGTPGYSGDGAAATAAQLNTPIGLAIDGSGNIYFSDAGNHVIRKISTAGVISTFAGIGSAGFSGDGGPATAAEFNNPTGMCFDASGNMFIADFSNSAIRKISPSGIVSTVAGTGTSGYSGDGGAATAAYLSYPEWVTVDGTGNIIISDRYNFVIRKVNPAGIISAVAGVGYPGSAGDGDIAQLASLNGALGVHFDRSGNLLVADNSNHKIRKINPGIAIRPLSTTSFCRGTAVNFGAYIFHSNTNPFYQWKIGSSNVGTDSAGYGSSALSNSNVVTCQLRAGGASGALLGTSNSLTMTVSGPPSISLSASPAACAGELFANMSFSAPANLPSGADITWDSLAQSAGFTDTLYGGIITTLAGGSRSGYSGDGGSASTARLDLPTSMAIDASGNIYIADYNNYRIRKVSPTGVISTFAGTGTFGASGDGGAATAANISPYQVAFDGSGNLYFTDISNYIIRKITPSGTISTIAGSFTGGYSGDGGPATAAQIGAPNGIVVTGSGIIYVSDGDHHVIRRISSSGIISTYAGNGSVGYSGEGGPATAAELFGPEGLAVDAAGNLYIAEYGNACIHKVSTSGIITVVAGTPGTYGFTGDGIRAVISRLNYPVGVTIDASGSMYIADMGNHVIRKVDILGVIHTVAGTPGATTYGADLIPATSSYMNYPRDVHLDASGNMFIAESNRIRKVGGFPASPIRLRVPPTAAPATYAATLTLHNGTCSDSVYRISLTVNPQPDAGVISGPSSVCTGSSITLTDTTSAGTWRRSNTLATVSTGGVVAGVTVGVDSIYYTVTNSCGTDTATQVVTINPLPDAGTITGPTSVCTSGTITLADAASGGTWSASNTNAVVSSTGVVGGLVAGLDTIRYTATTVCGTATASYNITINPVPAAGTISGSSVLCTGSSFSFSSSVGGGTWTALNTHASVSSSGSVTAATAGVDTIRYTVTNSCGSATASYIVTVLPTPSAGTLSGPSAVCESGSITLTPSVSGGAWGVTNSHAFASSSGVVSGISAGVDTIVYGVFNACGSSTTTKVVTVNPLPNAGTITGASAVCSAASITLSNTVSGGSWTSTTSRASVTSGGVITGISAGADTIVYTFTNGCGTARTTYPITVNPLPNAGSISGASTVCVAASMSLTASVTSGAWTAANTRATVTSSGVVTGLTAGTDTIMYSVTNGCGTATTSQAITVNPLPNAGTVTGPGSVCTGANITLTASVTGGTWFATNSNATVSSAGLVSGITAGLDTIVYMVTNSCGTASSGAVVTINPVPNAGSISGSATVCAASNITLTDAATGGSWSASNSHASVSSSGIVTGMSAGIDTIIYTVTNSCGTATATRAVTVNPLPDAGRISGATSLCVAATATLSETVSGGTWGVTNARASISSAGLVIALSAGVDTIIYTYTNSCGTATTSYTITINPTPDAGTITGTSTVCPGATVALTDAATGGSWTVTNTHASVSSTGVVSGLSAGVDTVVYTVTNSCGTATARFTITVNPSPNAGTITGASTVCTGTTITLADATTGGTWSATNATATVSASGVVNGVTTGTDTVIYTVTNSCGTATATKVVTINLSPRVSVIGGPASVCISASITLTDSVSGGVWTANNGHAVISSTGVVLGITPGSDTMTYTVTNSCGIVTATKVVTINPLPDAGAITGQNHVCVGSAIILSNTATGGTWTASNSNARISGITLIGATPGFVVITYRDSNSCGVATTTFGVRIDALPVPVVAASGSVLSTSVGYVSYQWLLNSTPIAGATSNFVSATMDGIYMLVVTDANGCMGTSADVSISLGVDEITTTSPGVSIFPNPSESVIHIECAASVNVSVFTIDGRLVLSENNTNAIDISSLANSMYIINVYDSKTGVRLKTERIEKMGY